LLFLFALWSSDTATLDLRGRIPTVRPAQQVCLHGRLPRVCPGPPL